MPEEPVEGNAKLDAEAAPGDKDLMPSQTTSARPWHPAPPAISRQPAALAVVCLVAAAIVLLYWVLWYTDRSLLASSTRQPYREFEDAFPLADGWLTLCLLLAATTLLRRRVSAPYWLLAAGAGGLYLFGMDVLYDLQHDIWPSGAGGAVEAVINALTLAMSVLFLRLSWTALVPSADGPPPREP
jgi:hypothetical protein